MDSLRDIIPVTKKTLTLRRNLFSCDDPYKVKVKVKHTRKRRRRGERGSSDRKGSSGSSRRNKGRGRKGRDSRRKQVTYKCYPLDHTLAKNQMMRFLERSRTWDCVSGPKQKLGNCWFNVMFMSFFISDYGFEYTRPLRRLMIRGERLSKAEARAATGTLSRDTLDSSRPKIHKLLQLSFLKLNACIQASIDCTDQSYPLLKNTNFIIGDIAGVIQDKSYSVYKVNDENGGNPIHYYKIILSYLLNTDFKNTKRNKHFFHTGTISTFRGILHNSIAVHSNIVTFEYMFLTSEDNKVKVLSFENNGHTYVLDSIIISNDEHYISFLTVNGKEYAFDGESYSRIVPMKWKHRIRDDTKFNLTGMSLEDYSFSFSNGSQILFYCRV
jgi:hypothetical protein